MSRQDSEAAIQEILMRLRSTNSISAVTIAADLRSLAALQGRELGNPFTPGGVSKQSIEAMRRIVVAEGDDIKECTICLEEMVVGAEISEMPCRHGFHCGCIEKWLSRRRSCPLCRYNIADDDDGHENGYT